MGMSYSTGRGKKRRLNAEINVVPYIDVMLVLLIIFMVTAPLLTQGVEVKLPEAATSSIDTPDEPVSLSIDAKGQYFLDIGTDKHQPLKDDDVVQRVGAVMRNKPDMMVLIRGDAKVDYGRVANGMALLQKAGVSKMGFQFSEPDPAARKK